jgi:hypothetical protein
MTYKTFGKNALFFVKNKLKTAKNSKIRRPYLAEGYLSSIWVVMSRKQGGFESAWGGCESKKKRGGFESTPQTGRF